MRRHRGGMAMVLSISLLLFTVAFGFATMVSLQLNLTTTSLTSHEAEMTARAAASQAAYEIYQKLRQYWSQPVPLSGAPPINLGLLQRYQQSPVFPAPTPDSPATCSITFDTSKPYFSTDNLDGALPGNGWLVANGQPDALVPANSVDLLVNTQIGGSGRVYEAVLSQQWPYGACSLAGPLVLSNCDVIGNIYAATGPMAGPAIQIGAQSETEGQSNIGSTTVQGDLCTWLPPGTPDPFQILTGAIVQGRNCYNVALGGSVPGGASNAPSPNLVALLQIPPNATSFSRLPDTGIVVPLSQINGMDMEAAYGWGGVTVANGAQAQISGNTLSLNGSAIATVVNGKPGDPPASFKAPAGAPSSLWLPSTDQSMEVPDGEGGDVLNVQYMSNTQFITGALQFNGGNYYLDGSLVNRASQFTQNPPPPPPKGFKGVWAPPNSFVDSGTYIVSNGGTLTLNNTVLVVSGDVDVKGIDGQNSVLLVGGRLTLTGGQMNAENKGIVILANHVDLRANGKFLGLVISQTTLQSTTYNANGPKLSVRGGLLSTGSMTLNNTDVQWDPYFLQLLNRFGSVTTTLFRQITQ